MLSNLLTWSAVGGFLGLITFVFTIWDRWVRYRPVISVVAKPLGSRTFPYLRVRNNGTADILIRNVSCSSSRYLVLERESISGAVRASVGERPTAIIGAGHDHDFALHTQDSEESVEEVKFVISWRKLSSPEIPMLWKKHRTSISTINMILETKGRALKAEFK